LGVVRAPLLALLLAGCIIAPLDVNGRRCPCAPGWTCDTVRDLCVQLDAGTLDAPDAPDGPDAPRPTDAGTDAPSDAGSDAWTPSFSGATPIDELNTAFDESDPTLPEDELEIFFTSDRTGGNEDVWSARRASIGAAWGTPMRVAELSSASVETDPEVSLDGLHIFFTSLRSGDQDVWESSRASRAAAWPAPTRVVSLSSADEDCCPVASGDGRRVVLASSRSGADMDLFQAGAASIAGPWTGVAPLTALNTSSADSNPSWGFGERWLLFDSDRPGGMGGRDVYLSMRASTTEPFVVVAPAAGLTSPFDDRDVWLAPDADHLYYANDASGSYDIYTAARD
jgi:hypothetical protein